MSQTDSGEHLESSSRWGWRRLLVICGVFLLLIGSIVLPLYFYFLSEANRAVAEASAAADRLDPDWRLEELEAKRDVLSDNQNSALHMLAVKQLMPARWPAHEVTDGLTDLDAAEQLSRDRANLLHAELAKGPAALREARLLADMPKGRFPVDWTQMQALDAPVTATRDMQETRAVSSLLRYDAMERAHQGDADGALYSCRGILNAGRALQDAPSTIPQLIRLASRGVCLNGLERTLAQGQPSAPALQAMQQLLEKEHLDPVLLIALRGERAVIDLWLRKIQQGEIQQPEFSGIIGRRVHARQLEMMTQMVEIAKMPEHQQLPELSRLGKSYDEAAQRERSAAAVLAGLLAPAISKMATASHRGTAMLRCAITAVAAERYRVANGRWPESLDELVPKYLQQVPRDPYDSAPLRIRRLGDGVMFYSVGLDGKDDGGKVDPDDHDEPGTDIGFRLWDVPHRRQPPRAKP